MYNYKIIYMYSCHRDIHNAHHDIRIPADERVYVQAHPSAVPGFPPKPLS